MVWRGYKLVHFISSSVNSIVVCCLLSSKFEKRYLPKKNRRRRKIAKQYFFETRKANVKEASTIVLFSLPTEEYQNVLEQNLWLM